MAMVTNDVGGDLVRALERAYMSIRAHHPDVPEAVIVINSALDKYGHFDHSRWVAEGRTLPEIMISAEGLKRAPSAVLATLMHEAAHGVARVRGVKDVSDNGRYHNKTFRKIAEEIGLVVDEPVERLGHSLTRLPEGEHADIVESLTPQLIAYREFDLGIPEVRPPNGGQWITIKCRCRSVRVTRKSLDIGPVLCGVCEDVFE